MATTVLALAHETPAQFWKRQDADFARRMSHSEIAGETFNLLLRQNWERKPFHKQTSIYELAELAEDGIEQKRLSIMREAARRSSQSAPALQAADRAAKDKYSQFRLQRPDPV